MDEDGVVVVVVTGGSLVCLFVGIENACIYFLYSVVWWLVFHDRNDFR